MSTWAPFEAAADAVPGCSLCSQAGGVMVWAGDGWRVVRVEDEAFPAYYRVISTGHVVEFSDLGMAQRQRCMDLVCAVERVLIDRLRPTKINLAAFGNMVPHLHWHVVARFEWDSHFPQPLWGSKQRDVPNASARLAVGLAQMDASIGAAVNSL